MPEVGLLGSSWEVQGTTTGLSLPARPEVIPCRACHQHPMRGLMNSTMDDCKATLTRPGVPAEVGRWKQARRRYGRLIGLNVLRGAASATGAAVVGGLAVWLQHH
jgi:hypothetical protein